MTIEQSSSMPLPMRAGGRATEVGMAFQAEVATWFAVHILIREPIGGRFGINNQSIPISIRLETGEGLDDVEVLLSDGGAFHVQCKTSANLGTGPRGALPKVVGQLVKWVTGAKAAGAFPDLTRNAALLAVRTEASRTLDNLESGCRAFDLGGKWSETCAQRNQAEREALRTFEVIATQAWTEQHASTPGEEDLVDLARIFRIARFAMAEGEIDWREASRLLGSYLYGGGAAGEAPLRDLKAIMRDLIANGAPADRAGILRGLRRRGHQDTDAPGFDADVAMLRTMTDTELVRLAVHSRLPLGEGVSITRQSDAPLVAAIQAGSLLVVGEPGAGKTGALVHAAAAIASTGDTIIFLSVDRFPGVAISADLSSELRIAHPVVEVLSSFPGSGRKILFIDALDAARGGASEAVFASLIEDVHRQLAEDWIVVASIRTFDLKNGRRFRQAFSGRPADAGYLEPGLQGVRHFLIPRLSETDLSAAALASPKLRTLLDLSLPRLSELLGNIFNLSLAAQLLVNGTSSPSFDAIRTQSELIDAYEDIRLHSSQMQAAAAATAAEMIRRRRLTIRKVLIDHAALDEIIHVGVLAASGDLVRFSHHVLFDHVVGRFHLEWSDPNDLLVQLAGDTSTGIMLAPALRFACERLWRADRLGRPLSWQLIRGIFSSPNVDPVLGNVALRVAVENIEEEGDISGLTDRFGGVSSDVAIEILLGRLARFVAMDAEGRQSIPLSKAITWARLAEELLSTNKREMVEPSRIFLQVLFQKGDLGNPALLGIFGRASRMLLRKAWEASPPLSITSENAISFVGKSFASDPVESRKLLDCILREPHFSQNADREAIWLAEQIIPITRKDPVFYCRNLCCLIWPDD